MIDSISQEAKDLLYFLNETLYYELEEDESWADSRSYQAIVETLTRVFQEGVRQGG